MRTKYITNKKTKQKKTWTVEQIINKRIQIPLTHSIPSKPFQAQAQRIESTNPTGFIPNFRISRYPSISRCSQPGIISHFPPSHPSNPRCMNRTCPNKDIGLALNMKSHAGYQKGSRG
ncbi:hypothetical protein VTJ04DRAFT_2316 [Mycothermus thermophilus]|uniref:uncharacterized protein n=1 Tax=Humicola insolens TaxID=85995 RepID=UPI0037420A03